MSSSADRTMPIEQEQAALKALQLLVPDYASASIDVSPNYGLRKDDKQIKHLILHYTGLPTAEEALEILKDPLREVSAHYLVHEDGHIVQMVNEKARAWHAGASFWQGEKDINSTSIGIEIVNTGNLENPEIYPDLQIAALIRLCKDICQRHNIEPANVLAHSDIAPERKTDPGEWFPWEELAKAGIGHFVEPVMISSGRFFSRGDAGQPIEALQSMLAFYGYKILIHGEFDEQTEVVVKAFQRHFRRHKVDGVADISTIQTLYQLLSNKKMA